MCCFVILLLFIQMSLLNIMTICVGTCCLQAFKSCFSSFAWLQFAAGKQNTLVSFKDCQEFEITEAGYRRKSK